MLLNFAHLLIFLYKSNVLFFLFYFLSRAVNLSTLKIVKLSEEEWETELEAELKDYESTNNITSADDKQWEKDCEDLLGDDDEDLK